MKKTSTFIFLFFISIINIFGQQEATTTNGKKALLWDDGTWIWADSMPLYYMKTPTILSLEIPKTSPSDIIISHSGYSLVFSKTHMQAKWVAYELTKDETIKLFERTDKFIVDSKIKGGTANDKDYAGSGYDRGHLAPASDMGWSAIAMQESFFYSNICPQTPSFNRGIWKRLEELVRTWAIENSSLYIVTGPVLSYGLPTIGTHKVSIPTYFYKVILDFNAPSIKAIGFIIPNYGESEPLQNFAVSIDSVEKFTGFDFFPSLPDSIETIIENSLCLKCWSWKSTKIESADKTNKLSASVQCKGTTKAGARCKNMTLNPSGYCYLHENQGNSNTPENKIKNETPNGNTTKSGQTIYTGPRGGQYHYSKSGNKVYERKK